MLRWYCVVRAVLYLITRSMDMMNIFRGVFATKTWVCYVAALMGCLMCVSMSILLKRIRLDRYFIWLGRNTIPVLVTHQLLILLINDWIGNNYAETTLRYWIVAGIKWGIIMGIASFIIYMRNRIVSFYSK